MKGRPKGKEAEAAGQRAHCMGGFVRTFARDVPTFVRPLNVRTVRTFALANVRQLRTFGHAMQTLAHTNVSTSEC